MMHLHVPRAIPTPLTAPVCAFRDEFPNPLREARHDGTAVNGPNRQ